MQTMRVLFAFLLLVCTGGTAFAQKSGLELQFSVGVACNSDVQVRYVFRLMNKGVVIPAAISKINSKAQKPVCLFATLGFVKAKRVVPDETMPRLEVGGLRLDVWLIHIALVENFKGIVQTFLPEDRVFLFGAFPAPTGPPIPVPRPSLDAPKKPPPEKPVTNGPIRQV